MACGDGAGPRSRWCCSPAASFTTRESTCWRAPGDGSATAPGQASAWSATARWRAIPRSPALPASPFAGRLDRERLPVAYAAADAVVVPSIATRRFLEPWGLVCNEAMSQGRPVVATDAVGAAAGGLVRDGETGLVVPAADERALAAALERLLADPQLRSDLGRRARKAVGYYTYERAAAGFAAALEHARR